MKPEFLLLFLVVGLAWGQEKGDSNAAVPVKKNKDKLSGKQGEVTTAASPSNATDSNSTQEEQAVTTQVPVTSASEDLIATTRGPPLIQVQPATASIFNREGPSDCIGRVDFTLMWPLGTCRNCTSNSDCDPGFVCCKAREVGIRIMPVVLRDCCVLKRPPTPAPLRPIDSTPGAPQATVHQP